MSAAQAALIFKKHWKPQQQAMAKYAQLVEVVQSAIESRDITPGDRLPTESDFAAGTPFSLGTIQRALRILVGRGVIDRRQGVGSFASDTSSRLVAPLQCRIFDDDWLNYLEVFGRVIGRDEIKKKGPWTRYLGDHVDKVLRVHRLLDVSGEFKVLSRFYIDPGKFGVLAEMPKSRLDGTNFRELLDREFGMAIRGFEHSLRVEFFDKKTAKALDCPEGTSGVVLEIVAVSDGQIPLYFQELYIPPNARTLHITDKPNVFVDG